MIQRIQTVFLIFAFAFQLAMVFIPVASFVLPDKKIIEFVISGLQSDSILNLESFSFFILLLFIFNELMLFVIVFLYKNRTLQMKSCFINIILLVFFQLLLFFFIWDAGQVENVLTNYKVVMAFPLLSAIFTYLAFRSIKKDEKLIRSIDRIR